MEVGRKYRITAPTIALVIEGDHKVACTVPGGAIVIVEGEADEDGGKFINVKWSGREALMFAADLQSRGKLISD